MLTSILAEMEFVTKLHIHAKGLVKPRRRAHSLTSADLWHCAAEIGEVIVAPNGRQSPKAINLPLQDPAEDRSFHTVVTADGTATHWQSRVGYYHFLKVKKACEARGRCQMVGLQL